MNYKDIIAAYQSGELSESAARAALIELGASDAEADEALAIAGGESDIIES